MALGSLERRFFAISTDLPAARCNDLWFSCLVDLLIFRGRQVNVPIASIVLSGIILVPVVQAEQFVYPAKGQSAEQQKADESKCYSWAVNQTGFDPAKSSPQAASQSPRTATGVTPGAGVRGAARGAIVGEVIGGEAGAGAAAGAVAARGQSRRSNAAENQQNSAVSSSQQEAFAKAKSACLEGRGYTVK